MYYRYLMDIRKADPHTVTSVDLSMQDEALGSFPMELYQLPNLQSLSLLAYPLDSLPEGIGKLTKLTTLRITRHLYRQNPLQLPADITALEDLEVFNVRGGYWKELPPCVRAFKKLQKLVVREGKIAVLPAWIAEWEQLELLDISEQALKKLPDLSKMATLQQLSLSNNRLTAVSGDALPRATLRHLNLSDNLLKKLPEGLAQYPHLERLLVTNNPIETIPFELLASDSLQHISLGTQTHKDAFGTLTDSILQEIRKHGIPTEHHAGLYWLWNGGQEAVRQLSMAGLLEGLRTHNKRICECALSEISRRWQQIRKTNPLAKEAMICPQGDTVQTKTNLKNRIEAAGMGYHSRYNPKTTTHIVVGKKLKNPAEWTENNRLIYLTEHDLEDFLTGNESRFLLEAPPEEAVSLTQNLSRLLLSKEAKGVETGLALLEGGGVPPDLVTELFLICKNPRLSNPIRKKAQQLLAFHASSTLLERLKLKQMLFSKWVNSKTLQKNIYAHIRGTELNPKTVGRYIDSELDVTIEGTRLTTPYLLSVLDAAERREHLLREMQSDDFIPNYKEIWEPYHEDLLEIAPLVTKLYYCFSNKDVEKQHKISSGILDFTGLDTLKIRVTGYGNCLPSDIFPAGFERMNIREIDLEACNMHTFPDVLLAMPNLQTIHIQQNRFYETLPSEQLFKRVGVALSGIAIIERLERVR